MLEKILTDSLTHPLSIDSLMNQADERIIAAAPIMPTAYPPIENSRFF
jgi:hypothetical protein